MASGTIKGVARKFGVHRRMVREAIDSAVPKPRKKAEREKPKMAAVIPWIEADPGGRPEGAAETAAHGAPHLVPAEGGAAGGGCGGVDGAASTCASGRSSWGLEHGEVFVPQTISLGPGRAGGLVRSLCRDRRRAGESVRVLHAEHGQRRGVSPGLSARQPTGVSGSARVGIRLLWRRVRVLRSTT